MSERTRISDYIVYDYDSDNDLVYPCKWDSIESKRKYIANLAQEIGWIIIEFSSLENKLESTLKFHLIEENRNKEIMFSLISKQSYSEKTELFYKMFNINYTKYSDIYNKHFKNFIEELKEIYGDLKEVGQIRNDYAHSIFSNVNESKFVERKTKLTAQGIKKEFKKYDFEDINNDFDKIYNVGDKLSSFNEKSWDCITEINKKHKS